MVWIDLCYSFLKREFYKFEDSFDHTQLMVRSKEGEKKRNIYVSSKSIKNVAKNNESKIKVIGVVLSLYFLYWLLCPVMSIGQFKAASLTLCIFIHHSNCVYP